MSLIGEFRVQGVASPTNAAGMLDEICEHFVEHADVRRNAGAATLTSRHGAVGIRTEDGKLLLDLECPSDEALQLTRTSMAEHLFFFAGADPFELTWSEPVTRTRLPNLHEATVVGAEDVTPHMRRVRFACRDVSRFVGGDMHVRVLIPPRERAPVWPGYRKDGRIDWPDGADELVVRPYTIRAVDTERREMSIDFWQHPAPGIRTPGADFARDALPGDEVAFIGPGSGTVPKARSMVLIGDETALPAIGRIAAEVPAGTDMKAVIEVANEVEEQVLPSSGTLDIRWLHRDSYPAGAKGVLAEEGRALIGGSALDTFVWAACEKQDVRSLRSFLKERGHERRSMYVAWYWEKGSTG